MPWTAVVIEMLVFYGAYTAGFARVSTDVLARTSWLASNG